VRLCFELDLQSGRLTVPKGKLYCLLEQMTRARDGCQLTATALASVVGKIVSMSLALGPVTRLMTCNMYALLNARISWCQELSLTPAALDELSFWLHSIKNFNGQNLWSRPSAVRVVYSNASSTGYGGYCIQHGGYAATSTVLGLSQKANRVLHGGNFVLFAK